MRAIGYYAPLPIATAESLVDINVSVPVPGPRDLLVRVQAISVNPVDVKIRASAKPPEGEAKILGWDAAGTVDAVGRAVTLFNVGDEVFYSGALDRPGANSEWHVVDERLVGRKPESLSFAQAAALPLTAITAWELLFDRLGVPHDHHHKGTILIINGAGGVGSILTQIARRLTGLTVIVTASRQETVDWVNTMGAHHVIDHHKPLPDELKTIGIHEVNYVAGLTGTEGHLADIAEILVPEGRLGLIDDPKTLDIVPFKRKSLTVSWEFMFTRSLFQTPDMIAQHRILSELSDLIDDGVLRTTWRQTFGSINAANLRKLHAHVESGKAIGKAVLAGFEAE